MDDDLKPIVNEPIDPTPTAGKTYTAQVTIAPIVARLQITKISFKNSGNFDFTRTIDGTDKKATVSWTGFSGNVKGFYKKLRADFNAKVDEIIDAMGKLK